MRINDFHYTSKLTFDELKALAFALNVDVYPTMTRDELLYAIQDRLGVLTP